jgi:hypothetical protein
VLSTMAESFDSDHQQHLNTNVSVSLLLLAQPIAIVIHCDCDCDCDCDSSYIDRYEEPEASMASKHHESQCDVLATMQYHQASISSTTERHPSATPHQPPERARECESEREM